MEKLSTGGPRPLTAEMLCNELKPWQIETQKAAFLDYLYDLYDRNSEASGLKGTYTGLWERFQNDCAEILRARFISTGDL